MKRRFYLYKNGSLLRQDNSLVLVSKTEKVYIPIEQIDIIFIFGHITLNKNAISLLNEYDIVVQFFSYYGNYLGGYYPNYPIKGDDLIRHVSVVQEKQHRDRIAKEIIVSSIHNMLSVLKYYNKKGKHLKDNIELIKSLKDEITCDEFDISKLLIYEARTKQIYYSSFNDIIKNQDFTFKIRTTNPPLDRVNAMLSYGYAILYGIIRSVLYRSRLQISLPFIHGTSRDPEGLQYDIADVFKPVIIDRLIFRMLNKNQLNESHFDEHNGGVYLNKLGSSMFLEELEILLKSTVSQSSNNRVLSYRSIISKEVHKITNDVHMKENYKGFRMKW
ncbi:MAG: CRISPR-associated endonuclease Cas1 [Bacilli bacterium]|jgi:CRISPR-associated protein Cas1